MLKYVFICIKESVIALTIFSNKFTLWQYKNLRQSHKNNNYSYCQTTRGSVKKRHTFLILIVFDEKKNAEILSLYWRFLICSVWAGFFRNTFWVTAPICVQTLCAIFVRLAGVNFFVTFFLKVFTINSS